MDAISPLNLLFLSNPSPFHFPDFPVAAPPTPKFLSSLLASGRSGDF
jgi:hypothetical protein